jgi:putative transposase
VHLVFSTKDRLPLLTGEAQRELHPYLVGVLSAIDCPPIQVGGVADHVHVLCGLSRTRSIAKLVEEVKTESSKWMKKFGPSQAKFHWQSGYGAFSVSQSEADRVVRYIQNQARHHHRRSFQDEYRALLDRHGISFDERYVWD